MHIELWEAIGLGLIVECPTGIIYSNQTGGTSCLHPEVEGVFVPLRNACDETRKVFGPENELFDYFTGPKHGGAGATSGLDSADADFIDDLLRKYALGGVVAVDRGRLAESHEAWVYVTVGREEENDDILKIFRGLGRIPVPGFSPGPTAIEEVVL
jgi:hypothetical protein